MLKYKENNMHDDHTNYFSSMISWDHITSNYLIALMVILVLFYILIFKVIIKYDFFQKIQHHCFKKCNSNNCRHFTDSLREKKYFIDSGINHKECLFTGWELSHIIFHAFIGFFFNLYVSLGISVGFEIYEHFSWSCASGLDLWWNLVGFSIGHTLRFLKNK